MPLLPVALYGLEVPAGEMVAAVPDFPATFRITMAAIDPTEEINEENPSAHPRATLKLIRQPIGPEDEDEDDNDAYMRALLGGGSDSEEDSEDDDEEEEVNGGPSDPAKSKKAQKEAAVKQLLAAIEKDSDEEMEDVSATNGLSAKAKGKAKATEDDDEDDSDSEGSEGIEIEEFVICTLDPERTYQQALDITVAENERVFFQVTGSHTIYLTGNYVVPDDNGHNHHHEVYDSDEESENDEDYDLSPSEDELEIELDGEESDELDGLDDPRITEVLDDEEEAPKLVSKADKKGKKRSAAALEESLDDLVSKSIKDEETPKLSKKQLKKLKNNKGDAVEVKAEVKESVKENAKGDKKVQFAKNLEQGPTGSTPEKAAANGKPKTTLGVKEVNGVKIDDKKAGSGPAAKSGNRVEMRYIGKLADGKVFDSNKKGKPFAFKLGKGEVIKGWDIGVAGMSVGGERRLTIPPHLAYGSSGTPGIPKNATLTFDVKLLSIK